jgi:hypothetical protein
VGSASTRPGVTGDQDFLVIGRYNDIDIVSSREFLR